MPMITKNPAPETYQTVTRELVVTGSLWGGGKSRHEYTLKDCQQVATLADAKRIAGDFASIEKARIRTVKRVITETETNESLPA